jgi:hypothetical protein
MCRWRGYNMVKLTRVRSSSLYERNLAQAGTGRRGQGDVAGVGFGGGSAGTRLYQGQRSVAGVAVPK